jgi:hypothetical protein
MHRYQHIIPVRIASRLRHLRAQLSAIVSRLVSAPQLSTIPTDQLAEELARRIKGKEGYPCHDIFYRQGMHLLPKHFYLPIPDDTDNLEQFWSIPSAMIGVDANVALALEVMEEICPRYLAEFRARFPLEGPLEPPEFYLINGGYMAIDAHVYYCLIRHFKPRRIVEIGNGNSTLLAIAACDQNADECGWRATVASIDPYPWEVFKEGCQGLDELIRKRVQDVPLSYFEQLTSGDMLFIDSSHVIRSGNDVHYEYLEILPRLRPGVFVHVHDISLPRSYPKVYFENHLYWNEQYLLQAFLAFNHRFEVVWPGNYMMIKYPERMLSVFPEFERMRQVYPDSEPTAFWMRVKTSITG